MSSSARWSVAALLVVIGLVVAIWPRGDAGSPESGAGAGTGRSASEPEADPGELADLRDAAALEACPQPSTPAGPEAALAGVELTCLADGAPVAVASAVAGTPTLVNLWAYWCAPCAEELPYLQQFSDRAGDAVNVLTVHTDPNESAALSRLADYGVTIPGVQDARAQVRAALGAPAVLPVSVLIRADGTVARILPQPFHSVDEIADAVETDLGVAV